MHYLEVSRITCTVLNRSWLHFAMLKLDFEY